MVLRGRIVIVRHVVRCVRSRDFTLVILLVFLAFWWFPSVVVAQDWPQWGGTASKNMAAPGAKGIRIDFDPGRSQGRSDVIDPATTKHVRWIAKLGSQAYGNVTVAGGRIFIGTNNASPRDPKYRGDRSVVYCLDEKTGELIWQFNVRKSGAGKVGDWEFLGICSSPSVDGDRVYLVTNLCEVICLDVKGNADGNDGPFKDEPTYLAGKDKPPIALSKTDADVIWRFDMAGELGVFPHNITSSSVLVAGDRVYATTSNGVDWSHRDITAPRAPTLISLDKRTGKLVGEEASRISTRLMHCNWSSPAMGRINTRDLVLFGAGDGFCYGFDSNPEVDDEGFGILKEIWRFDCNPPTHRFKDGQPIMYPTRAGPSEVIATPVFYDNRVYVAVGQDPEHGEGVGALNCIDAAGKGDISQSGLVWRYTDIGRSISTASIADGLLFIADYAGVIHCLDATTGQVHWKHDTLGHFWASTLVADGKVIIGNEDGILTIMAADKQKKILAEIEFDGPIYSSAVFARGVLYVATMTHLYAIPAMEDQLRD